MMTEEEIRQWEKRATRENLISFAKDTIVSGVKVCIWVATIYTLFTLLYALVSKELDPINDIKNIIWWFCGIPVFICLTYYFLLKYICKIVKYAGMDKEDRGFYWNLFRHLIIPFIIQILVLKTALMAVSETSVPIWMHYGPIFDAMIEYYQPIWADHVNSGYVFIQSHLTFLPPLEQML